MEPILEQFSASSCSPSGAKTSQMGVTIPATPEYEIFHPEFPPNVPNSERNHLPATIYLLAAPYPTPPSHPASSAYLTVSAHPKDAISS